MRRALVGGYSFYSLSFATSSSGYYNRRIAICNNAARYKFNEIVEYRAGINGQEWLGLTARYTGFDRVPRAPFTRDRYHRELADIQILRGHTFVLHSRERNQASPGGGGGGGRIHISNTMRATTFRLNGRRGTNPHSFEGSRTQFVWTRSFGEGNESDKLFVICLVV